MGLNPRTFAHDSAWHILPQHTQLPDLKSLLNCSPPHPCFVTKPKRTPLLLKLSVVLSLCLTVTPGSQLPPTPLRHHPVPYMQCVSILFASVTPMLAATGPNTPVLGHCVQERWGIMTGREAEAQDYSGPGLQKLELTTNGARDVSGNECPEPPGLLHPLHCSFQTETGAQRGIAICPGLCSQEPRSACVLLGSLHRLLPTLACIYYKTLGRYSLLHSLPPSFSHPRSFLQLDYLERSIKAEHQHLSHHFHQAWLPPSVSGAGA